VQVALDPAALGIGREDLTPARRLQLFDVTSLHNDLPVADVRTLRPRAGGVKWPSTRVPGRAASLCIRLPAP